MGYTFAIPNEGRRVGQSAKTPPFHGGMTGSTPVRGTNKKGPFQDLFCYLNPFYNQLGFIFILRVLLSAEYLPPLPYEDYHHSLILMIFA